MGSIYGEEFKSIIDYNKIEPTAVETIKSIETKPHILYIRYLISKCYSPRQIRRELYNIGMSAPHEDATKKYYSLVIDPLIKYFNLGEIYSSYKSKIFQKNKRNAFSSSLLNFAMDVAPKTDYVCNFIKFIKALGVEQFWCNEITKYYGSADNFPSDEKGHRFILTNQNKVKEGAEKVIMLPQRHLVDKMIIQGIGEDRIAKYLKENTNAKNVSANDISLYRRFFFNVQANGIEEKLKYVEIEVNSLSSLLDDLNNGTMYRDMSLGDRMAYKKQTEQRLVDLQDNLKSLNAMYSESMNQIAMSDVNSYETLFTDVMLRAYNRFKSLDTNYKDREVVDCLVKITKVMSNAHDKIVDIKEGNANNRDIHSQEVLLTLYKERADAIAQEQIEQSNKILESMGHTPINPNIDINDIGGIEELGANVVSSSNDENDTTEK